LGVALAIAFCLWIIGTTATFGLSRLFVRYAVGIGNLSAGNEAVRLTPKDPEAHLANAEVLSREGQSAQSIVELERAVALRPSDYSLWLSLGLLRDQTGDTTGALAAFDQAVKRAPYYAQPRWLRGNLLLRTGQYDAAWKELNQAARSEPELIPNLIDLAWAISRHDPKVTAQLAAIDSDKRRIAFTKLLARQGIATEAVTQFRTIQRMPADLKRELVAQLLAKNAFKEAFELWSDQAEKAPGAIYDGGFEATLTFDQVGFGWRVTRTLPAIALTMDSSNAHSGSKSLRLEFNGESGNDPSPVSQLVMVEPGRRYRISFATRSENIVSGGLPTVVITDAGNKKQLGHSEPFSKGSSDWHVLSFDFQVPAETTAIFLALQREPCATSPCPAFGSIWLDSFSLQPLNVSQ
jgi:hypothetical protein